MPMMMTCRTVLLSTLTLLSASVLRAQGAPDLSGHWDGSVQMPGTEIAFQLDLAPNAAGELGGAITIPSQNLHALPLQRVSIKDKIVMFSTRRDQSMTGRVSDDSRYISGDYAVEGFLLPFTLKRTGDARLEPPVRSARISTALEGTWNGSLQADGGVLRVSLTMANQPDGTATGRLVVIDQGGLEVPVAIAQEESRVTLDSKAVGGQFNGVLNSQGAELTGTWTQGSASVPLTFHRASDGVK